MVERLVLIASVTEIGREDVTLQRIRDLLNAIELDDNHEFATAYVNHVEGARATGAKPLSLVDAVMTWNASNAL